MKYLFSIVLSFFYCYLQAQSHLENEKKHHTSIKTDTCFSSKIDTYRKNVQETYYEVKIYCKICGESDFKNFIFYKRQLVANLPEAYQLILEAEKKCKILNP